MELWKKSFFCDHVIVSTMGRVFDIKKRLYYDEVGYIDRDGRRFLNYKGKNMYIHQVVWITFNGEYDSSIMTIDHIVPNISDNRLDNLQLLTRSENSSKGRKCAPNGTIGITEKNGVYRVRVRVDGVNVCKRFPDFDTAKDALSRMLVMKEECRSSKYITENIDNIGVCVECGCYIVRNSSKELCCKCRELLSDFRESRRLIRSRMKYHEKYSPSAKRELIHGNY